jgi:hypothetical protein
MVAKPHSLHCCFCGAVTADVELLFVSQIGGLPPVICSGCVQGFAAILVAHRANPTDTALAITALNKAIKSQPHARHTA